MKLFIHSISLSIHFLRNARKEKAMKIECLLRVSVMTWIGWIRIRIDDMMDDDDDTTYLFVK